MHTKEETTKHFKRIDKLKTRRNEISQVSSITGNIKKETGVLFNEYSEGIKEIQKEIPGGLMQYLEKNELPSDLIFHGSGPERYFDITHNTSSPYSTLYYGDTQMLLDLVNDHPEYLRNDIIDIGCGDGIKVYEMMKEAIKNKKIDGTFDYLGLDDSDEMLDFAKKKFYAEFYPDKKHLQFSPFVKSDNIDPTTKKVRPRFKKARFQTIKGLENRSPKMMLFLGGTFGNLPPDIQKSFLEDIKKMMQAGDVFVLSYFRILDREPFNNVNSHDLARNFYEREKKRYADNNVYYYEKEIDIANFKKQLPGIQISHDDFDVHMELDEENMILYDVRTFKKDIVYYGETIIQRGESLKSEGTKIDEETLLDEIKKEDHTKNFVESLYKTEETKKFICEFLQYRNVDPKDVFIDVNYDSKTGYLIISIKPLVPVTFKRKENGEEKSIIKYPQDTIILHKSKRFYDDEIKNIVNQSGLKISDEIGFDSDIAGQDVMKLLIIQK